ncbi:MAG: cell division transport system permease protein [Sphingobacteriales bacterium]|jgi:cell division transport system permease protein
MAKKAKNKAKTTSISTVISFTLVLLMLGLLGVILLHAQKVSDYVKENIVLSVFVDENAKEVEIIRMKNELELNKNVKSTQYVSKEIAAVKLQEELGEDFVDFLGYNPLQSSIDVYLNASYANNDSILNLKNKILQNPIVKEVYYQESLVDLINNNIKTISIIMLAFSGILLFIALALINNTIRLAMYSQRFLIKSMQLVGATHAFISKPYVLNGVLHGITGALVSIVMLMGGLYYMQKKVPELILLNDFKEFLVVFISLIIISVFISGLSTWFAVKKYLKLRFNDLFGR